MIFIFYTDFVSQLSKKAESLGIEILEEFDYPVGSFLKLKISKDELKDFIRDFGFLIEEYQEIKKSR